MFISCKYLDLHFDLQFRGCLVVFLLCGVLIGIHSGVDFDLEVIFNIGECR